MSSFIKGICIFPNNQITDNTTSNNIKSLPVDRIMIYSEMTTKYMENLSVKHPSLGKENYLSRGKKI